MPLYWQVPTAYAKNIKFNAKKKKEKRKRKEKKQRGRKKKVLKKTCVPTLLHSLDVL
jgi:hypothetical protein